MNKIFERLEKCLVYEFFWNLWHNVRDFWLDVRSFLPKWLAYSRVLWKSYDFDFTSILDVEKYQLRRVQRSIKKEGAYYGYERDLERIDLAIKLLDITMNDCGYSDKIGDKWICTKKVNASNAKRFMDETYPYFQNLYDNEDTMCLAEDELYVRKAWYIYHELRYYFLQTWWW